jgi:hypothetical protein
MRLLRLTLGVALAVLVMSSLAHAQATITGVVKDTSGAVLPGVVVEASSPALIEKTRSVVTDGTGQYRIVDLRPGSYTVTFTLSGFNTFRRDGIALEGAFVATVNADLRVGALTETITVSGESPVVDVQSSQTTRTLDSDLLTAIPSARGYQSFTVLQPGLNVQGADVGGSTGALFSVFQAHGGRRNEGQIQINGLSAGWQGMGVSGYVPEVGSAQEVTFQITGGLGEAATGGPQMNLIPRTGGNRVSGFVFGSWAGEGWQGSNLSAQQRTPVAQGGGGLREIGKIVKNWDANGGIGGPIVQDKLWFFWTGRHTGSRNTVAGIFLNRAAGDPNRWDYDPGNEQAIDDNTTKNSSIRLTWQASPRNKFGVWWDEQKTCQSCTGGGAAGSAALTLGSLSPEADGSNHNPIRMGQIDWTSPFNNRLLLEASYGLGPNAWFGDKERKDGYNANLIEVQENAGLFPGISYRGQDAQRNYGYMGTYRGSASYITGAHRFKAGAQLQQTEAAFTSYYNNSRVRYTFTNGAPTQLTMYGNHGLRNPFEMDTFAAFVQDVWTAGRLTLQGGLRFERITSFYPEAVISPDRFIPQAIRFAAQEAGVGPKDLNPRFGAAYDVFGTGRTALKFSMGRYPTPDNSYGAYGFLQQPANRVATMTNRNWNDRTTFPAGDPRNGNYIPDCDLLNPDANGECGAMSVRNFGRDVAATTYDPKVLSGWNVREYSWDMSVGVQQQILPRVSAEVSYVRRSWGNQTITDNRALTPADFDKFAITAPSDPRLPGGGGYRVTGLYEVKEAKFGQTDNFVTHAKNFGDGRIERYNGVDMSLNARAWRGVQLQGGLSFWRQTYNDCAVAAAQPETLTVFGFRTPEQFCDTSSGLLTTYSGLATYTIPKIDVLVSGTLQSRPFAGNNFPSVASQSLAANLILFSGAVVPELGRPLAGGAPLTFVNLIEAGELYGDRITQVDLRVSKILRFAGRRANVGFDIFNLFNTNAVYQYNTTYSTVTPATWLQPSQLVVARFAKLSVQFDF